MTKKQQAKLEAIEREVDATKKKRGRPVGGKTIKKVQKSLEEMNTSQKEIERQQRLKMPIVDLDAWDEPEIPHLRGGDWKWNFEKKPMSLPDKITLVLTLVNVAILGYLIIKNLN